MDRRSLPVSQAATKQPPFFIVGVQRSGTTLVRLLLNAHSQVAVPEEARFLTPLLTPANLGKTFRGAERASLIAYLRASEQLENWSFDNSGYFAVLERMETFTLREVIGELYASYCASEGKSRWGDKSLFFEAIPLLHRLFPEAQFIHVVRDGRDAFMSWRKMDPAMSNPAVMGLDWAYKEKQVASELARLPAGQHRTVFYEALVTEPAPCLAQLCEFLSLEFEPQMLEFYNQSRQYIGQHHSSKIFGAIDAANIHKWRHGLTRGECKAFELCAATTLRRYGYELHGDATRAVDFVTASWRLMTGLPRRVATIVSNRLEYRRALRQGRAPRGLAIGSKPEHTQ